MSTTTLTLTLSVHQKVLLHRRSAAAEVVALAAGDAPHHVQDRSADTQGADDVHLHDAISP